MCDPPTAVSRGQKTPTQTATIRNRLITNHHHLPLSPYTSPFLDLSSSLPSFTSSSSLRLSTVTNCTNMNSITFVVDKLTPPSTPLHHPPSQPQSSSSESSTRPDSGYFSIYSSDHDDSGVGSQVDTLLRRRQVENPLDATNIFDGKLHLPDHNIRSRNAATRGLMAIFNAIVGILWGVLFPFARVYSSLKRLGSRGSRQHSHSSLHPSLPPAFSDILPKV